MKHLSESHKKQILETGSYSEYVRKRIEYRQSTPGEVHVATEEQYNAAKRAGEDELMPPDYVTSDEFARHELMDRETNDRLTIMETTMKNHMQDYQELKRDVKQVAEGVGVINQKLSNGITEKLNALVTASGQACDADKVRLIIQEENGRNKKRGREWLALVTGLCAVAATVIGLVL